jgi:hypothetical protein
MSVWSAFWRELMTPDRFEGKPYDAFINQVGHVAAGVVLAMAGLALGDQVLEKAPNPWLVWPVVALGYAILIELSRQKWFGADTVLDSAFVSLGAVLIPASMTMTPSGRWFRVEDWSAGFLFWLACTTLALAAYIYPRLRQAYGGTNDPAE